MTTERFTLAFLAVIAFSLLGCSKGSKTQSSPSDIVQANIGGRNFYIPKAYLSMPYTGVHPTSALIQAWYPGDAVVPGDADDLWRKKQWYKNISILIDWYKQSAPMEKIVATYINMFQATKIVGVEYGLLHQTQPPSGMPDHPDIWIDKNSKDIPVFITCDHLDNTAKIPTVPQCKQYLNIGNYTIEIHYNRRLLPNWKEIQGHVINLFNSFHSKQSASAYFNALAIPSDQGGDQP